MCLLRTLIKPIETCVHARQKAFRHLSVAAMLFDKISLTLIPDDDAKRLILRVNRVKSTFIIIQIFIFIFYDFLLLLRRRCNARKTKYSLFSLTESYYRNYRFFSLTGRRKVCKVYACGHQYNVTSRRAFCPVKSNRTFLGILWKRNHQRSFRMICNAIVILLSTNNESQ